MSCRWCGNSKHNRTTCPKRLEYIKNNPASWEAKRHAERLNGAGKRTANCSWCGNQGHNKRNCASLVEDSIALTKKNANYRKHVLEYMRKEGLGIGALVNIKSAWGYDSKGEHVNCINAIAMIVDIDWDKIAYPVGGDSSIQIEYTNIYDYNAVTKMRTSHELNPQTVYNSMNNTSSNEDQYYKLDIVSPGHVMIENESEWLKGKLPASTFDRSVSGQRHRNHNWAQSQLIRNKLF